MEALWGEDYFEEKDSKSIFVLATLGLKRTVGDYFSSKNRLDLKIGDWKVTIDHTDT